MKPTTALSLLLPLIITKQSDILSIKTLNSLKIVFDICYTLSKVHGICDGSGDPLHGHMVANMPIIVE